MPCPNVGAAVITSFVDRQVCLCHVEGSPILALWSLYDMNFSLCGIMAHLHRGVRPTALDLYIVKILRIWRLIRGILIFILSPIFVFKKHWIKIFFTKIIMFEFKKWENVHNKVYKYAWPSVVNRPHSLIYLKHFPHSQAAFTDWHYEILFK